MVTKNLPQYATEKWEDYIVSVTEASKSNSGVPLVVSDMNIYNFDDICKSLFPDRDVHTSADGLRFQRGKVELVEFKSGFSQIITKDKFIPSEGVCDILKERGIEYVCDPYWKIFWKLQKKERKQLLESIRAKAIESYIFLEKHILPVCDELENGEKAQLILTVVVDEDGVDGIEDILAEAAETDLQTDNCLSSIRQSLKRLVNRQDANGSSYFYDYIQVFPAKDFVNYIKLT